MAKKAVKKSSPKKSASKPAAKKASASKAKAQERDGILVIATSELQHGGRLYSEGERFFYHGELKDGQLPQCMKDADAKRGDRRTSDKKKTMEVVSEDDAENEDPSFDENDEPLHGLV